MFFFTRIKLYLLVVFAFAAGVLGVYFSGVQRGIDNSRSKLDKKRLDDISTAKKIEDEVDADPYLVDRANQWLRHKDKH
jgi:Na+-translocating ferredoxin:NAD+ oxidoreductase RnfG subunit